MTRLFFFNRRSFLRECLSVFSFLFLGVAGSFPLRFVSMGLLFCFAFYIRVRINGSTRLDCPLYVYTSEKALFRYLPSH
jgi:hypothetical protein